MEETALTIWGLFSPKGYSSIFICQVPNFIQVHNDVLYLFIIRAYGTQMLTFPILYPLGEKSRPTVTAVSFTLKLHLFGLNAAR